MDRHWLKRTAFEMAVIAAILFACTMVGLRVYDKLSDFHVIIQIGLTLVVGVGGAVAFIGMFVLRHDEHFWKSDTWLDRLLARWFKKKSKSTPASDEAAPDKWTLH